MPTLPVKSILETSFLGLREILLEFKFSRSWSIVVNLLSFINLITAFSESALSLISFSSASVSGSSSFFFLSLFSLITARS